MRKKENIEYNERLKQSIKNLVDGIKARSDLEMIYGMAKAAFHDSKSRKDGAL